MNDIQREIIAALHEINEQLQDLHHKFDRLDDVLEETGNNYMTHDQINLPLGDNS